MNGRKYAGYRIMKQDGTMFEDWKEQKSDGDDEAWPVLSFVSPTFEKLQR
jgi:hypothetical protein